MTHSLVHHPKLRLAVLRHSQRGVTLVEVLIVVGIMVLISSGIAFAILPQMQKARLKTAHQGAKELVGMAESWRVENSDGCPTVSQLKKDKYLSKTASSEDPWGTTFEIVGDGDEIQVRSAGPDKQAGTQDDIAEPKSSGEDEEG